jgi:hypothetical protein
MAKPIQKVVIPVRTAVLDASNSVIIIVTGGEYDPEQYAVRAVAKQQRTMWYALRWVDHCVGFVYRTRFGSAGGSEDAEPEKVVMFGGGRGVSKVK